MAKTDREPKRHVSDAKFAQALRKNFGIYAHVAADLGMTRQAVSQRVKGNPKFAVIVAEIEDTMNDASEGVVVTAIVKDKDLSTAKWWLERKGKARGFSAKSETEVRLPDDDLDAVVGAFGGDVERLRALRAAGRSAAPV